MPMDKSTFANKKNLNRLLDLVDQQINILDLKICEQEIINNSWIRINEKLDLIFDTEADKKWEKAIEFTGIDFSKYSSLSGSA